MQKTVTRARVFLYVRAGDHSSTTASLHRQSRGNHLPICHTGDVTMGPLCITDPPEVPCFPCEQLCPHTSSASKVCRGGQGTHWGPAGESLLASTRVYSVCLPFRLATLSFAPGSLLGKGIPHNASATFWHRQGALVLSDTPQSKASSGNSFRIVCTSAPNLGGKKPALLLGEEPGALLKSQACLPPPCLAALPCPDCCLLRDSAPSYHWRPARFQAAESSHSLAWWQGCLAAACGLPRVLLGRLWLTLTLFHGHSCCGGKRCLA